MSKYGTAIFALLVVMGCGGEPALENETEPAADASAAVIETPDTGQSEGSGDPCAPLERELVAYDTSGTPFPVKIDQPEGWEVSEFIRPTALGLDFLYDVDGDGTHDYDLRFGTSQNLDGSVEARIELWPKIGMEVTEVELDEGTLYIGRKALGELHAFQALVPTEGGSWNVRGGITDAPDECSEAANDAVLEILKTLRSNPDMSSMPEG